MGLESVANGTNTDEDISVEGMLHGAPAHRPKASTGHAA